MTDAQQDRRQDVLVVIGAGGIGVAIARRQGAGKAVLLADLNQATLAAAARELEATGYRVIAPSGAALVISSMAGYMLPALPTAQDQALANTPAAAASLLGLEAGFVTGSDLLIDGVIAALRTGQMQVTVGERAAA